MIKAISTSKAPEAIGPYSQAVRVGDTVYLSGQLPIDPSDGEMVANDAEIQARQVMKNIQAILAAMNLNTGNIAKTTIFIQNIDHFPVINEVYSSFFDNNYPARSTVEASNLPKGALVEIEAVAKIF